MSFEFTVVLPTHNPRADYLAETLAALQKQTLPLESWELLLIDNRSEPPLEGRVDLSWHPHGRIILEGRLGLTRALLAGFHAAAGAFVATVADDNVLEPDYLREALRIFAEFPRLGAIGGKSLPRFDEEPPPWVMDFQGLLALRDFGPESLIADPPATGFPKCAPLGAGMVLRTRAAKLYAAEVELSAARAALDRAGDSLASSGDNDMALTALKHGYSLGYFPTLSFTHLMPPARTSLVYLSRLQRSIMRSFVQMLAIHELCPWPPILPVTLPMRKLRAWFRNRPWAGPAARLTWERAAGQLEGQADNWRAARAGD